MKINAKAEKQTRSGLPEIPGGSAPPFAMPELLDRCMGNAAIAVLILDKFEKQLHSDIVQIQQQVSAGDSAELARTAHALKGAAGAVAAAALHDLAAELETSARQNRLDAIAPGLAFLRAEVDRCLSHIPIAREALAVTPAGGPAQIGADR